MVDNSQVEKVKRQGRHKRAAVLADLADDWNFDSMSRREGVANQVL